MNLFRYTISAMWLASTVVTIPVGNAQEVPPPISTERPSIGNSPDLIPCGSVQFENGAGISFQKSQYVADLPETLVRLGLSERVEVRFLFSDEVYQRSPTPHVASFQSQDPVLSAKFAVGRPNQVVPRSAILSLSIPRGGQSWTSGSYDPAATAIWTQTIDKKYFVNELAGIALTTMADARRPYWAPSVAGGRSLTEAVTAFAEYAPTVLPNGRPTHVVDGGFLLIHKKLTQFDLRAGYLKDSSGYHTILSVGYSARIDGFLPWARHLTTP